MKGLLKRVWCGSGWCCVCNIWKVILLVMWFMLCLLSGFMVMLFFILWCSCGFLVILLRSLLIMV